MPIFLIGYMCSGKTTIGKLLAKKINFHFVDLDNLIEKELGLTIKDIFLNKGEDYFRQIEHEILTNYVFNYSTIVATGGGTPCYYNNNNFMNHTGFTIYLKVSCEELVRRLKDNHQRPLILENKYNLYDFVSLQIKEREQYYCKSKLTFESDCASTDQLCTLLKKNYEQFEYRFKK